MQTTDAEALADAIEIAKENQAALLDIVERILERVVDDLRAVDLDGWRLAYALALRAGWHPQDLVRIDLARQLGAMWGGRFGPAPSRDHLSRDAEQPTNTTVGPK